MLLAFLLAEGALVLAHRTTRKTILAILTTFAPEVEIMEMEGVVAFFLLVVVGLLILFPGLPALAVVLLFLPRCRPLARDLALIGVISFVLVI